MGEHTVVNVNQQQNSEAVEPNHSDTQAVGSAPNGKKPEMVGSSSSMSSEDGNVVVEMGGEEADENAPLIGMGECRICQEEDSISNLESPCACTGSLKIASKVAKIVVDAAPEILADLKLFFINLFKNFAERLGWDPKQGESHLDTMLSGELLTTLASFGDEGTLKEAGRHFWIFLEDRNTSVLSPDLRRAVYVAVVLNASKSNRFVYHSLLQIYRETDLSQEKTRILGSLPSCRDHEIIDEFLNFLLSS